MSSVNIDGGLVSIEQAIRQIIEDCEDKGMVKPFIFVATNAGGFVIAVREDSQGRQTLLCKNDGTDGPAWPITCLVTGQNREDPQTVVVRLDGDGIVFH